MTWKIMAVAAILLATALAGCATDQDDALRPDRLDAYAFKGYTAAPPVAVSGDNATSLDDHPLLGDALPRGIEQMVDGGGAEPNIGITGSGAIFVTTFDQVRRSTDHGESWQIVYDFTLPGAPEVQDQWSTSDPMLWVDTDTDRIFTLNMQAGTTCFHLAWSDDDGATWSDRIETPDPKGMDCGMPYVDHPKLVTAPSGPDALLGPVGYDNVVYTCVNKIIPTPVTSLVLGTWCKTSLDGGRTWAWETNAIPPEGECAGINGHPAAFADGTVVVPAGHFGGLEGGCKAPPRVAISSDNGQSWEMRRMPGDAWMQSIDPDITITPDGTAYMVYRDADQMTYLVRSTDRFETWEGPWRISPHGQELNVFQAITSGDDGRISVAFLGTTTTQPVPDDPTAPPVDPSTAVGGTRWNLYVASSIDADAETPSFVVQQINPDQDPVQVGCIWLQGGAGGPNLCRNLLDFIDMTRDNEGRFHVAITDGCDPRNGCAADPDNANYQSRDRQIAVAVQDRGESLFADQGILPSLGLEHPPPPEPEAAPQRGDS